MDTFFERMSVRLTGSDKLDVPVLYVQFFFHFTDIGGEDGPQICCTLFLQLLHFISFKIYLYIYIYTHSREVTSLLRSLEFATNLTEVTHC